MTDIPIIFSAPMVRALLDGRKTMTRRLAWYSNKKQGEHFIEKARASAWQRVKPGDRLWVREEFSGAYSLRHKPPREWPPNSEGWYWADGEPRYGDWTKPKPSIHMPRWASRLTLIVTATKIERLQAISDADAQAEGIVEDDGSEPDIWYVPGSGGTEIGRKMDPLLANRPSKVFAGLWRALHGPDAWDANPEVVALTFTVHKQNIDAMGKAA